jgi:hypothetical protein
MTGWRGPAISDVAQLEDAPNLANIVGQFLQVVGQTADGVGDCATHDLLQSHDG